MKKFDLRSFLTPQLKTQFAKSEEKNHFDVKIKTDMKEEVDSSAVGIFVDIDHEILFH